MAIPIQPAQISIDSFNIVHLYLTSKEAIVTINVLSGPYVVSSRQLSFTPEEIQGFGLNMQVLNQTIAQKLGFTLNSQQVQI